MAHSSDRKAVIYLQKLRWKCAKVPTSVPSFWHWCTVDNHANKWPTFMHVWHYRLRTGWYYTSLKKLYKLPFEFGFWMSSFLQQASPFASGPMYSPSSRKTTVRPLIYIYPGISQGLLFVPSLFFHNLRNVKF